MIAGDFDKVLNFMAIMSIVGIVSTLTGLAYIIYWLVSNVTIVIR